jgi:hypothetical protein
MNAQPAPHPEAIPHYTLEPLRTEGQHSLDPDPADGITKVTLRAIRLSWNGALHKTTITTCDDVFASAAAEGGAIDPIPPEPRITEALLEFQFIDSPMPHPAQIAPPCTLECHPPEIAERIKSFLAKHHFLESIKQSANCVLFLLAATLALVVCPSEENDDDDETHRRTERTTATARP